MKGSGSVYNWALIQYPLVAPAGAGYGLSNWISDFETGYGEGLPALDSGYRTPTYNSSVGGSAQSRHMFGDAADLYAGTSTVGGQLQAAAAQAHASYIEPWTNDHVHADWRNYDSSPTSQP